MWFCLFRGRRRRKSDLDMWGESVQILDIEMAELVELYDGMYNAHPDRCTSSITLRNCILVFVHFCPELCYTYFEGSSCFQSPLSVV